MDIIERIETEAKWRAEVDAATFERIQRNWKRRLLVRKVLWTTFLVAWSAWAIYLIETGHWTDLALYGLGAVAGRVLAYIWSER